MASYSVADAKHRLPALLSAVERGERVTITRYGKPIAELRPVAGSAKQVTAASIDWIEQQLLGLPPADTDSVAQLRLLRDEDDRG